MSLFSANERICGTTQNNTNTTRAGKISSQCFHLGERKMQSGKKTSYICNRFYMQGKLQIAFPLSENRVLLTLVIDDSINCENNCSKTRHYFIATDRKPGRTSATLQLSKNEFKTKITAPEISEWAFTGRESCQRSKDLLQDELPMLLIARENLETRNKEAVIYGLPFHIQWRHHKRGLRHRARSSKLTAVTSLMAQSCSSLTFSTKNGVIPIEETWKEKKSRQTLTKTATTTSALNHESGSVYVPAEWWCPSAAESLRAPRCCWQCRTPCCTTWRSHAACVWSILLASPWNSIGRLDKTQRKQCKWIMSQWL